MAFKEGDRVVWEKEPGEKWKVHHLLSSEWIQIIRHERGGFASIRVPISEVRPFDRYGMIKQAVREVLLSEEFLTAFAAAWVKTPILHESEISLHPKFFVCEPASVSEEVKQYSEEVKKYER